MKIGDKVRFLNEVGGGTVAGFQDKNTVLVRDEDGFDVPVLIRECVVIGTDDYQTRPTPGKPAGTKGLKGSYGSGFTGGGEPSSRFRAEKPDTFVHAFDDDEDDKPITFTPTPVERRGGDRLNVVLGYVAADPAHVPAKVFEAYLVNDSNYYLNYTYASADGVGRRLRAEGTAEPNTKVFLEEFTHEALPEMERIAVQFTAFKRERVYQPKPAFDVELRLDATKFYKPHTFGPTDFFEDPALLVDVVRDDRAVRSVFVDAESLRDALTPHAKPEPRPAKAPARKPHKEGELIEVDLHASEVLETTAGMTNKDILDYQLGIFRRTMDEHHRHTGQRIVFIHGKGDGVLRQALLRELRAKYKPCTAQDASFREYGYGATMVTIR